MIIKMVTILVCIFTMACGGGDPQDLDQAQGKAEILRDDCSPVVGCSANYVTNMYVDVYDGPRETGFAGEQLAWKITSLEVGVEVSVVKTEKIGIGYEAITWALIDFDGGNVIRGWVPMVYLDKGDVCQDVKVYGDIPKFFTESGWHFAETLTMVSPGSPVKILENEDLDSFMGTVVWHKVNITVDDLNIIGYLPNLDVTCQAD